MSGYNYASGYYPQGQTAALSRHIPYEAKFRTMDPKFFHSLGTTQDIWISFFIKIIKKMDMKQLYQQLFNSRLSPYEIKIIKKRMQILKLKYYQKMQKDNSTSGDKKRKLR